MAKKKKPVPQGPSQMDRARAARAYVDTLPAGKRQEDAALAGFMEIFHPEIDPRTFQKKRKA